MYTRSYYPDVAEKMGIPENYDGTVFAERDAEEIERQAQTVGTITDEGRNTRELGLDKIPFLSGLLGKGGFNLPIHLKMPDIGTEEILLLAAAAFLFFSKDGDKECAIMLLLLLLIN